MSSASSSSNTGAESSEKNWLPIESNPEIINPYVSRLGLPSDYEFTDILSVDDWAIEMLPRPVYAVMLLYPIKDLTETHRHEEAARILKDGQIIDKQLYYTKQTIGNACGTIGILHAIANNSTLTGGSIALDNSSWFARFINATKHQSADERANALQADNELETAHVHVSNQGSTDADENTNNHFIAFVGKGGYLYELDGRKQFPINHGLVSALTVARKTDTTDTHTSSSTESIPSPSTASNDNNVTNVPSSTDNNGEDILEAALQVVQNQFMKRDPMELRFTMVALVKKITEE